MNPAELRRLIVRHRHVAPMLSVLLAGTNARLKITDLAGEVILHREGGAATGTGAAATGSTAGSDTATAAPDAPTERHPIVIEDQPVGWVEGPRPAGAIASVISYAAAREADKRALAREALDCYRELNLIYDLAEQLGGSLEVDAVARVAVGEATRLQSGSQGFLFVRDPAGGLAARPTGDPTPLAADHALDGLLGAILLGEGEIVNDVAADPRANAAERAVSSLVAAPLKLRGERIGVVGTASVAPFDYPAGDLKIVTALAALTAPAIQQASIHESVLRQYVPGGHGGHVAPSAVGRRLDVGR